MKHAKLLALTALTIVGLAAAPLLHLHASQQGQTSTPAAPDPTAARAAALKSAGDGTLGTIGEIHLRDIRQVTFGGQNAEAYFSADDKQLIFQHQGQFYAPASLGENVPCDQIYTIPTPDPDSPSCEDAATPRSE